MEELIVLVQGIVLGFAIAAPVGPIGLLCIRRTIQHGPLMGFFTGFGAAIAAGNHFMAHRTGFTPKVLGRVLQEAGFEPVAIWRRAIAYELQVKAFRPPAPARVMEVIGLGPDAAG